MKNSRFSKISAFILLLSLCVGMIVPFSVSAETGAQTETKPKIVSQNVTYNEKFCLMYAVDASTVAEGSVKLYLYEADPATGAKAVKIYEVDEITAAHGNLPIDCYIFTTEGVAAYAMSQNFYVQAVDAAGNKSDVKKYSVGEYLYERLASDDASDRQRAFYGATLDFGAGAQKAILKETDPTKYINNFCYVKSLDGTLVNGFSGGIYSKGETVTVAKSGAEKCTAISYASDGGYTSKIITDGSYIIPSDAVTVELSAGQRIVYRDASKDFENYTEGTTKGYFTVEGTVTNYGFKKFDDEHGMIYSATFGSGAYLKNEKIDTSLATAANATAVEYSFDIRVTLDTTVNTADSKCICFEQKWKNGSNSTSTANSTYGYFTNGYLVLGSAKGSALGSGSKSFEDVKLGDWFHVRIVTYKGDSNRYFYINGSDVPSFYDVKRYDDSSYSGDLSTLTQARINSNNANGAGFTVELDNVFYGYTMDKNPNAQ